MPEFFRRKRADGSLGRTWWTNLHGRRVSTRCRDLRAAQAWRRARERRGADPRHAAAAEARLDDAVAELLAELLRRGRAKPTLKRAREKLGQFVRIWGADCPLARIDAPLVAKYVDARLLEPGRARGSSLSRTTVRDELAFLRQLLKVARRNGVYALPVEDVLPLRFEARITPVTRWVRQDDLPKLLAHVEPRHAALVCFILATGTRLGEAYRARREDVDMKRGVVRIRGTKTERSKGEIPISPFLRALLVRALRDAEGEDILFRKWPHIQRDMKAACDRAGVPHVTPNDLRRSFGKWHRARGFVPSLIAVLLRHADDKLAQTTYATVEGPELGRLVELAAGRRHKTGTRAAKIGGKAR